MNAVRKGGYRNGYRDAQIDDPVRSGACQGRAEGGPEGPSGLFACEFSEGIHATATLRDVGHPAVFRVGLPRGGAAFGRLVGPSQGARAQAGASLDDPPEGGRALAEKGGFDRLLDEAIGLAGRCGLIAGPRQAAGDGTGLESRHVSHYFAFRRGKRYIMSRWPKLTITCDDLTHLILSAKMSRGPGRDTREAPSLLRSTARRVRLRRALWDAGCDAEGIHRLIREELGAHSLIPPKSGRPTPRCRRPGTAGR